MSEQHKKNYLSKAAVFAVTVLTVILTILCLFFIMRINTTAKTEMYSTIDEVTLLNKQSVDETIKLKLGLLEAYSSIFSNANDLSDNEIVKLLDTPSKNKEFDDIRYIDGAGRSYSTNAVNNAIITSEYYTKAMNGETTITEELPDSNKQVYIYFSVPVKNSSDEVTDVLAGRILKENFNSELKFKVFNCDCSCFAIDRNGGIVLASDTSQAFATGDNLFSSNYFIGDDGQMMKNDIQLTSSSGNIFVETSSEKYILGYARSDYYDWTIISAIPFAFANHTALSIHIYCLFFAVCFVVAAVIFINVVMRNYKTARDELKNQIEISEKLAYVDSITGCSTWSKFELTLPDLMKDYSVKYAIISFDIDKFRAINDMLGHEGGDEILKKIAGIIKRNLSVDETFSRSNSDLFYILLTYKAKEDIFKKLSDISSDIDYQITEFKIVLSIGIYEISDRTMPIRIMADRADLARRSVKNNNDTAYAFFDSTMLSQAREEKEIENVMEQALETGEFKVYLQPKVNLDGTSNIVGAEALVRWLRNGEIISPVRFIPLFEKNHFVVRLDMYIFEEVCCQQKKWINMGMKPFVISVNMSRVHLQDTGFVYKLAEICRRYNVSPEIFEIEITESAAFENLEVLERVFKELKTYGFHISIDDFGTGYSSLNMLKNLPVDVLKIDREFLSGSEENERACEIISHVISLAMALKMKTICEGIETIEQVELLTNLGCDMAQGFYFARPMPIENFEKLAYPDKDKGKIRR